MEKREVLTNYDSDLFFANQVIQNACATQALLAVLLNRQDVIEIGEELNNFKQFTQSLDPQMKGLAISNQQTLQRVHNSFSRPEPFVFTEQKKRIATEKDDVFHFIAFVPFKNKVYEIDGCQQGPILVGSFENEDEWINIARNEINQRIQKYSQDEVRFNLLAITKDKKYMSEQLINEYERQKSYLYNYLKSNQYQLNEMQEADYQNLKLKMMEDEGQQNICLSLDLNIALRRNIKKQKLLN
ncbi:peptidase c12 family protein, putative [Ichthyophthirius multifiliis]|uniref:Ubiquitin carboxyl-terminal hydrolase n=1 Tax=Ichthyophthirius multifiliis TaxID=5932 RepID=G0QN72_ICHMU|nr:peptidase c12 family protein, putative [Ichthyophthirius multifiliis]EGR33326.1 peptidase c12 family protein, putative [Ichthyophthirius multifiliis]|eukprot:XP_004037312.1 peptidase c12 family protein, putative [Ichthyophthirius multifiliis]